MPPSWKKSGRIARLISGLRSNRAAASSLSVETGFPTSLADLLVKNHSRLKTKKLAATAAAIQASSRPPSPPTPPTPPPAVMPSVRPSVTPGPAVTPAPSVRPSVAPSPAAQRAPAVRLLFSFPVAEMLALVLLAIGEKQLVLRITVVAFVLMALDWLGFRVFELLTPCAEARKRIVIDREFEASESSVSSEGSVSGESVEDGVVPKVSRKKSWRRLVPKRLRSKRSAKDARDSVDELDSGSDSRRISSCGSEEEEAEICVVQSVEGSACECRSVSSRRLLLFVVLLFGLAGGRVAALAVTVAWFMLTNSIDTLWRRSRVDRVC